MPDIVSDEERRAEVAALNHEIYQLKKRIQDTEKARAIANTPDPFDPFDNPTEYKRYRDDYSEILPPISTPEYKIPLEPAFDEKRRIKRFYAIGGWCTVLQFVLSNALAVGIVLFVKNAIKGMNPDVDQTSLSAYLNGSSILVSLNMIVYLLSNVGCAFIGMKIANIKPASLIRTRSYDVSRALQYCIIAAFIWVAAVLLGAGVNDIFEKYGYSTNVIDSDGVGVTKLGFAISTVYTCAIAPVTEELFFRGMLLRVYSKANQRFAVFATAVFFGLAHGNLPQFFLAFLLGVFLAHITLKHGSIIPSIIVHVFVNTSVTIMGELKLSDEATLMLNLGLEGAAAIGAIFLLIFRGSDKLPSTTPAQSRRGFALAKTTVGVIAAFVLYTGYTLLLLFSNKT